MPREGSPDFDAETFPAESLQLSESRDNCRGASVCVRGTGDGRVFRKKGKSNGADS